MNKKKFIRYKRDIVAVTIFFILWEILARLGFANEMFLSRPSRIWGAFWKLIFTQDAISKFLVSMQILLSGLGLAIVVGFFIGVIFGAARKKYAYIRPFVLSLNAMPTVAIMPLLILWFGIGQASKIIVVFLLAVTPIIISTIDGVHNTNKKFLLLIEAFGGNRKFAIKNIYLYSALEQSFSGIRVAIGRSVVGIVIADLFGAGSGLGYLISYYGSIFQVANLMAVLLVLLIVSLTLTGLAGTIEKKIIYWK